MSQQIATTMRWLDDNSCYRAGMTPREELSLVEQHISETEDSIVRQLQLIEHLAADGHDTREAEELLQVLEQPPAATHQHRQLILAETADKLPE